jgi:hypothetical protein
MICATYDKLQFVVNSEEVPLLVGIDRLKSVVHVEENR